MTRVGLLALLAAQAAALVACGRQRMDMQPKYSAYEASARFAHAQSALARVPDTVPTSARDDAPPERTRELLERGRERYGIYCAPCHGDYGDGDGRVVTKFGFPSPPSLHEERLRTAPDSHFVDVITHGYGAMYPYAAVLPPRDRWAIVGYLRALELARHTDVAEYPAVRREIAEQAP